jgi:OHCU decarboxylase
MTVSLDQLNGLPAPEAHALLLACCGSARWASRMVAARPFESVDALLERGDDLWRSTTAEDREEAFAQHPRIGERSAGGRALARDWSVSEQRAATGTDATTRGALAEANAEYERRFGRLYIVCATGLRAEEILANLEARLNNDPEWERRIAAEEQRKITRLRLEKLCPG